MNRSAPSASAGPGPIRSVALAISLPLAFVFLLVACDDRPEQVAAVASLNDRSQMLQVACLDVNDDGRVDAGDADTEAIPDLTGDGVVDEADLAVLRAVTVFLPEGRPEGCNGVAQQPDWQITEPPDFDCAAGDQYVLLYGIGGGAVQLDRLTAAAGVRWMLVELSDALSGAGVPHQIASVAPGINGANNGHAAGESWSVAYLTEQLKEHSCLEVLLLGHSHGGVTVTAVAARLEEQGFADRVLLNVLVDRVEALYQGDTVSIPQQSPVLNLFLPDIEGPHGEAIDQQNVENIQATDMLGPADGERGGDLAPVTHTTLDNSPEALGVIEARMLERLGVSAGAER